VALRRKDGADIIIRPKVLDLGSADFSQRATAIVEGEKAALAAMPQIRERVARLQAERTAALHLGLLALGVGAGDVVVKPLRQIVTAVNDGAIAAQMAFHYIKEFDA